MSPGPRRADITRRRSAAAAGAALLVFVVTGIVVNALSSDGGGGQPAAPAPPPRQRPPEAAGVFNDPEVGVVATRPKGWSARRRRGAVRLRSGDRAVLVAISSPAPARRYESVLATALDAIRREYADVTVSGGDGRALAGRPTVSAVVSATSSRGTALRVLVAAVRGRSRAYLVEVFAARDVRERRLAEAQTVIGSLQLGK